MITGFSYRRTLITAPTIEPLTVSEAKDHLRVTDTSEDVLLVRLIKTARQRAEEYVSRALISQTWEIYYDEFLECFEIPLPPLQSVTSVKYVASDGTLTTVASSVYTVDSSSLPGRVYEAYNESWPGGVRDVEKAITIRFVAGYGDDADDVPEPIRSAMLLDVGHLYENRESVFIGQGFTALQLPLGWEALLYSYRFATL